MKRKKVYIVQGRSKAVGSLAWDTFTDCTFAYPQDAEDRAEDLAEKYPNCEYRVRVFKEKK